MLLLTGLHQFNEVSEEDVAVAVAESFHLVADFAGVVVDHKARLPRLEVLVVAHGGAQFLFLEQTTFKSFRSATQFQRNQFLFK